MKDSKFLDARGQSASFGDQQLTKIEAAFKGWGCNRMHSISNVIAAKLIVLEICR